MKNMFYLHIVEVLIGLVLTMIFGAPSMKLLLVAVCIVLCSDAENIILRNKRNRRNENI